MYLVHSSGRLRTFSLIEILRGKNRQTLRKNGKIYKTTNFDKIELMFLV